MSGTVGTYEVRIVVDGIEFIRLYGVGENALSAIEDLIYQGQLIIPSGRQAEVVVINQNGLAFKFDIGQL